jgi:Suppressor of fused protein (SUFU)
MSNTDHERQARALFLSHLASLSGGLEPEINEYTGGGKKLWTFAFPDLLAEGSVVYVTYGVSRQEHSDGVLGRPELILAVQDRDRRWGEAMGRAVFAYMGESSFSSGSVLELSAPVIPGSQLTKFMIFLQSVLDPEDASVAVDEKVPINLVQLYPVHDSEVELIRKVGPTKFFFELGIEFMDVRRSSSAGVEA